MQNKFHNFFSGNVRFNSENFNDFFSSGMQESSSPILSSNAINITKNLSLKVALISLGCYLLALILNWFHYTNISYILLLITFFLSGTPALIQSLEDISNRIINIDILMTLAAFGSILINQALEGALLLVLFAISESLEDMVSYKAKSTLSSLKKLTPYTTLLVNSDGTLSKKQTKSINVGDIIRIKSGEIVPLDGIIIKGSSSLNLTLITGEKLPKSCFPGDFVPSGAHNLEGSLDIQVSHKSADSTVEKIVQLVIEAQKSKPHLEQKLQSWSNIYAITIISLSIVMIFTLPFIFHIPFLGINSSIYRSLAFLIAASPCALILAMPIAYLSAINSCAKKGILLKGGIVLDNLSSCTSIALDKTGTLTTGNLTCSEAYHVNENTNPISSLLSIVLTIEQSVNHPIAQSIVDFIREKNILPELSISQIKTIPGYGVSASYKEMDIFIGKSDWILPKLPEEYKVYVKNYIDDKRHNGETCSLALIGSDILIFTLKDSLRPGVKKTIQELKKQKIELNLLTGDSQQSAFTVAKQLGINNIFYNLDPKHKLEKIKEMSLTQNLIMIGDGINDAPSLTQAHVGIAMGGIGSATAIEAADVVFLHDNICSLSFLLQKAKKTQSIVKENLFLALGIIILISIPALCGLIPLWLAVVLHEGSTVIVGLNALRLLKNKD